MLKVTVLNTVRLAGVSGARIPPDATRPRGHGHAFPHGFRQFSPASGLMQASGRTSILALRQVRRRLRPWKRQSRFGGSHRSAVNSPEKPPWGPVATERESSMRARHRPISCWTGTARCGISTDNPPASAGGEECEGRRHGGTSARRCMSGTGLAGLSCPRVISSLAAYRVRDRSSSDPRGPLAERPAHFRQPADRYETDRPGGAARPTTAEHAGLIRKGNES